MKDKSEASHPYMPNSVPALKAEMLKVAGAPSIESLFAQIPADHRLKKKPALPKALRSESELRRHLTDLLSQNRTCAENLNFLGGGCWQHYVPAVCDEIVSRAEFLTPVLGTSASEHGRNQAYFEFGSQLGELLNMEFVGLPVYSWGCASGHAIRMTSRLNGRREVLVPASMDPERLSVIRNYCEPPEMPRHIKVMPVAFNRQNGLIDMADLRAKLSAKTTAVYIENPGYLGVIETQGPEIAALAHKAGAEMIVGVDPISLGVLAPPADYGADIVVGTMQSLGVHMNCGGGVGGFMASRDEVRYAREYPTMMMSITDTVKGEHAFSYGLFEQSSYGSRDKGKDWTGNSVYLWAIANAVYMSLLGPVGFSEIGALIVQRSHYAMRLLAKIRGVKIVFPSGFFKEFVVDFNTTGKSVVAVNKALRERKIFGGRDLSKDFPAMGQSALYCVTEIHTEGDIERLARAVEEAVRS